MMEKKTNKRKSLSAHSLLCIENVSLLFLLSSLSCHNYFAYVSVFVYMLPPSGVVTTSYTYFNTRNQCLHKVLIKLTYSFDGNLYLYNLRFVLFRINLVFFCVFMNRPRKNKRTNKQRSIILWHILFIT